MRCIAIYNEKGKIIAAKRFDKPEGESFGFEHRGIAPILKHGHTMVEIDMPKEHASLLPEDFIYHLNTACEAKMKRMKEMEK